MRRINIDVSRERTIHMSSESFNIVDHRRGLNSHIYELGDLIRLREDIYKGYEINNRLIFLNLSSCAIWCSGGLALNETTEIYKSCRIPIDVIKKHFNDIDDFELIKEKDYRMTIELI